MRVVAMHQRWKVWFGGVIGLVAGRCFGDNIVGWRTKVVFVQVRQCRFKVLLYESVEVASLVTKIIGNA